jgi:Flp pilus assembly pilin Flp
VATSLTIEILTDAAKAVSGINSIDKKTSSLGQTMKGVGGAIAGAFSTKEILGFAQSALGAGLALKGAMKNVNLVFGEAAGGVKAWGETAAGAFGMTASAADEAAAKVGVALTGFGMSQQQAATASEQLVQRSAELAKVLGVDQAEVLARVQAAMRGRTAGLKDYGVQVAKGSDATAIFNAFMDQTSQYSGRADTAMGEFHATMGNLTEQIGMALIPVLNALLPIFQWLANWATTHKATFTAIVLVVGALALAFSIAATAASILAVAQLSVLWPVLLVAAGIVALIAVVVLVIKYWGDLVGWLNTAWTAVTNFVSSLGILVLAFGPLGAAILVVEHFGQAWNAVKTAVDAVVGAIEKVVNAVGGAAGKLGDFLSHIPHIPGLNIPGVTAAGAGPSATASAAAAPVVFAPQITFTGDVGDPVLAGRRIVAALEQWTAANGRRRVAALVAP